MNENEIEIKRLGTGDEDLLWTVIAVFEGAQGTAAHLSKVLADDSNIVIVAHYGGEPAGFLLAHRLRRIKDPSNKIFLYDIEVAGLHRRKGVGRALVSHLLEVAKRERSKTVFVFTNHDFKGAPDFYDATGAEMEGDSELLYVYRL